MDSRINLQGLLSYINSLLFIGCDSVRASFACQLFKIEKSLNELNLLNFYLLLILLRKYSLLQVVF